MESALKFGIPHILAFLVVSPPDYGGLFHRTYPALTPYPPTGGNGIARIVMPPHGIIMLCKNSDSNSGG